MKGESNTRCQHNGAGITLHRSSALPPASEEVAEFQPGSVEPAPDRPDRYAQDLGDLLVFQSLDVLENQNLAVLVGEALHRVAELGLVLGPLQGGPGADVLRRVVGLQATVRPAGVQADHRPLLPL